MFVSAQQHFTISAKRRYRLKASPHPTLAVILPALRYEGRSAFRDEGLP
jgi:hypothetical protein